MFDRVILGRLGALLVLVIAFYAVDWTLLRRSVRGATAAALVYLGHEVACEDSKEEVLLTVDNRPFSFSPDCTYVDLILVLAPFCWSVRAGLRANVLRLLSLALIVSSVNLIRLIVALHLFAQGRSWFAVHELPDYVIYYPSIAVIVILTLVSDCRNRRRADGPAPPSSGAHADHGEPRVAE